MFKRVNILFAVLFLICFYSIAPGFYEQENLTLNFPVSRDFKIGERHNYSLKAAENEFIEITCERKGIDIGLAAFSPNGEKISISNAPGGFAGFDKLIFVAPKSGEYRIEISSRRPGTLQGKYTILLKEKHLADENDLIHAQAMKFLGESRDILQGSENRYEKAMRSIEKLELALPLFEKLNDLQGQANTLFQIGDITANEYGKNETAIQIFEKALQIWEKIDDDAGKAMCLTKAAYEFRDSGLTEKSLAYFNAALLLQRKINDPLGESVTLSYLCRLYNDTQKFQEGFEACRTSLNISKDTNPINDYLTYLNFGALYENTGDSDNSIRNYQTSLERASLVKEFLNPIRVANVKGNIAIILHIQKKFDEALNYYQEVISVSEKVKRPIFTAYFCKQASFVYLDLNQYDKALEYAQKSLSILRQVDPRRRQGALNAVGKSYEALGQFDKAREMFIEAVEVNRQNKDLYAKATSLYNLAQLEKKSGNLEKASDAVHEAVNHSEIIRAKLLGKNQRSTYLGILKKYYDLEIELLADLYEKNHDAGYLEKAWQQHEKVRARSLLENFLENGFNLNQIVPKEFFQKEQTLLESVAEAETKRTEAKKTNNLNAQKEAEANLQKSLDDYQVLQEEVRRNNPKFSEINQLQNFTFADAQKTLDESTSILEFSLGDNQSYAWLIGKNSVKMAKLPSRNDLNKTARDFYSALTDRNSATENSSIEKSLLLSQQILQPFYDDLSKTKRLVVIADGSLQLIPFSALSLSTEKYQPLVETIETVSLPSFSSFVYLRENKTVRRLNTDKTLAIFADPVFYSNDERFAKNKVNQKNFEKLDKNSDALAQTLRDFGIEKLSRLPFSRIEAEEIEKFAPQQTTLAMGTKASRSKFLSGDFSNYRFLHFATHGFLNQQNPDLSGLVLSLYDEKRQPQNGFLRVIDLYSLRLNADLVVLSACQTGLGKDVDGEGIVGLTRGFMYAGASGIVSSLWRVEDRATAELMKHFYYAMLKENKSPSAALQYAQNKLRQTPRFNKPQNWAAFTLTGEWK